MRFVRGGNKVYNYGDDDDATKCSDILNCRIMIYDYIDRYIVVRVAVG